MANALALSLQAETCQHRVAALSAEDITLLLAAVPEWSVVEGMLQRQWRFADHAELGRFAAVLVWLSERHNHHPEVAYGYNQCVVRYATHSVQGLSRNDFVCAAKINALLAL